MRKSKPTTVTLGPMQASLEKRLKSGSYDSASEILRSALRAQVEASLADPGKSVPATDVFKRLRTLHDRTMKTSPCA